MGLDNELEQAVNEVTTQELKVNTLAIMKKVAMSPTTVMGYAYVQAMKTAEGAPYFVGDIGDFVNWCVRFALKFGYGVEFAVMAGKPTMVDLINKGGNN